MTEQKPFFTSKTNIFAAVTIVASIANMVGVDIGNPQTLADNVYSLTLNASALIGGIGAIWGRVKATKRISLKKLF